MGEKHGIRTITAMGSTDEKIVRIQLGEIKDKRILDFGSGLGITADYFAEKNEVTAVEPDAESIANRWQNHVYEQIQGSTQAIREMPDASFDVIICHNVFEYATDREDILKEFARLLKPDGYISLVKHNRPGRVMQMVVLLNDFDMANQLLDGKDGTTSKFGAIHYYEDGDILRWCPGLAIEKTMGMRTFWDLQQNQEVHKNKEWQDKMIQMELRVCEEREYRDIAFFHHLIIKKADDF